MTSRKAVRKSMLSLTLLFPLSLVPDVLALSPMRAGIGVVEITPPIGSQLSGFDKRRPADKVHDSLLAKILVLKTPESSLAFVASDLYQLQSARLVTRIRDELGIAHTLLLSSHPRAAPSLDSDTRTSPWGQEV